MLTIEKWNHAVERLERGCIWACEMFERDSKLYPSWNQKEFLLDVLFSEVWAWIVLPVLILAVHGTQL